MLDPVYARVVDGLLAEYRAGRLDVVGLCEGVRAEANPRNARALLDYLPELEARQFEWWFTARFGNSIGAGNTRRVGSCTPGPATLNETWENAHDAIHRAILARREPV